MVWDIPPWDGIKLLPVGFWWRIHNRLLASSLIKLVLQFWSAQMDEPRARHHPLWSPRGGGLGDRTDSETVSIRSYSDDESDWGEISDNERFSGPLGPFWVKDTPYIQYLILLVKLFLVTHILSSFMYRLTLYLCKFRQNTKKADKRRKKQTKHIKCL